MEQQQRVLLAASIAGLLAAGVALAGTAQAEDTVPGKVPCYGINKCKGTGDCGGKGHSCHGANDCKGQGYLSLDKETCLKIENGRLTAEPEGA